MVASIDSVRRPHSDMQRVGGGDYPVKACFPSSITSMQSLEMVKENCAFVFLYFFSLIARILPGKTPIVRKRVESPPGSPIRNAADLADPVQFLAALERKPERVIDKLITLAEKDSPLLERIVLNLVDHWKAKPGDFLSLDRQKMRQSIERKEQFGEGNTARKLWVAAVDDLLKQFVLSESEKKLQAKLFEGYQWNDAERDAISLDDGTWKLFSNHSEEILSLRATWVSLRDVNGRLKKLQEHLLTFIVSTGRSENYRALNLESDDHHVEGFGGSITLGNFFERMISVWHLHPLRIRENYQSVLKEIKEAIDYFFDIKGEGGGFLLNDFPNLQSFLVKFRGLLENPVAMKAIHEIIIKVLDEVEPVPESFKKKKQA